MSNLTREFVIERVHKYFDWEKLHALFLCGYALIGMLVGGWLFFSSVPVYVGLAIPLLAPLIHILFRGLQIMRNREERKYSVLSALDNKSEMGLKIELAYINRSTKGLRKLTRIGSGVMLVGCIGILFAMLTPIGNFFLGLFTSIFVVASLSVMYAMIAKYRRELYANQLMKIEQNLLD